METIQSIKAFFARLAGAPRLPIDGAHAASRAESRNASRDASLLRRVRHASELYAPDVALPRRTARQQLGAAGELQARRHLERAGLTFVAANVLYRDGELDLVMRERPRPALSTPSLVFVEVRRRTGGSHGGAGASITRDKRRRIVAAAAHYLVGLGLRTLPPCRFDVVTIDGDPNQGLRIEWIRDAFRDEG